MQCNELGEREVAGRKMKQGSQAMGAKEARARLSLISGIGAHKTISPGGAQKIAHLTFCFRLASPLPPSSSPPPSLPSSSTSSLMSSEQGPGHHQQPPASDSNMDQTPFARPISTVSATGGERISQAPTLFVDAPSDSVPSAEPAVDASAAAAAAAGADDLQPPTALARLNSTPSNLSVAGSSNPPANNLPYRNSLAPTAAGSAQHLGGSDKEAALSDAPRGTSPYPDLSGRQAEADDGSKNSRKKLFFVLGGVAAFIIVAVAVAVPVAITQTKKSSSSSNSSSSEPSTTGPDNSGTGETGGPTSSGPTSAVTGGDGTTITTDKGTTFTYVNKFGGVWYDDPNDPYNNNAQAQSWSPPLSQEWDYQNTPIRG